MSVSALDSRTEFLNANASKAYPLDQSTGGAAGTLPSSLLTDAYILVDGIDDLSSTYFYISKIEITSTGFLLSITCIYTSDDQAEHVCVFDRVIYCSFETTAGSDLRFIGAADGISISGAFTVTNPRAVINWPPSTDLTAANGLLSPLVIKNVSGLFVTGLVVGGNTLTGDITLAAGSGIELSVVGSTILITNTKYNITGGTIASDAQLVAEAVRIFGEPVRSINGVYPDSAGNLTIIVPASENTNKYYICPTAVDSQTGTIQLDINKDPCVENTTVETLMQNIAQLNIRAGRLDAGIKALDNALNSISIQLTRL